MGIRNRGVALMSVLVVAIILFILVMALSFTLMGRKHESPVLLRQTRMKHLAYGAKQLMFLKMKWAINEYYYADLAKQNKPLDENAALAYNVFIGATKDYQARDDLRIDLAETDKTAGETQTTTSGYMCSATVKSISLMSQKDGKQSMQDTNRVEILVEYYPDMKPPDSGGRVFSRTYTDFFEVNFKELF